MEYNFSSTQPRRSTRFRWRRDARHVKIRLFLYNIHTTDVYSKKPYSGLNYRGFFTRRIESLYDYFYIVFILEMYVQKNRIRDSNIARFFLGESSPYTIIFIWYSCLKYIWKALQCAREKRLRPSWCQHHHRHTTADGSDVGPTVQLAPLSIANDDWSSSENTSQQR